MKKKMQFAGIALVLTTLSAAAFAHGGRGKMDTNGDGKVTLAEAQAGAKQKFERMDKNKNGVVTKDELSGKRARYLEKADTNKDGKVTLAEAQAKAQTWFQKLDTNKDGVLTKEEFHAGHHGKKDDKRTS
ncbi:MAG TPA: EF-hand domain-containing protein [Polyangiaceae bacterium]|nr:EF-hand domain-containing protein [Polyangiaceae bacterium]